MILASYQSLIELISDQRLSVNAKYMARYQSLIELISDKAQCEEE